MAKAPVRHDIGLAETIGLRPTMEDTTSIQLDYQHIEQHGDVFLAVYDGHGGTAVSKWLAEHLHRYVSAALTNALSTTIGTKAVCATCGRDLSQMVPSDRQQHARRLAVRYTHFPAFDSLSLGILYPYSVERPAGERCYRAWLPQLWQRELRGGAGAGPGRARHGGGGTAPGRC